MTQQRRTQADRREETRGKVLTAARHLFGEQGYAETSLDDIAEACDLTIRPIYHYFESKLGLFKAVVQQIQTEKALDIEQREEAQLADVWAGFMASCEDPHFRQIILIDAPNLLGRSQMMDGAISKAARSRTAELLGRKPDGLSMTMLMGALSQAALYIAEHGASAKDYKNIRELINYHSGSRDHTTKE